MTDNVLTFIRSILGSLWGRLFKSSWVYRAVLKLLGYYSKAALAQSQKYEDSLTVKAAENRYMVPMLVQVPLSKIHAKALMLDGSWTIGTAVLGQSVTTENTVVQVKLPDECSALSYECTGNNLLLRDVDFFLKEDYFVLTVDPLKLFDYVYIQDGEPYYDIWVYGVHTEASLDNYSVLTDADLNKIPDSGELVWDSYVQGLTESKLNQIICNGLGADLAKVSGYVRKVWTEGPYNYVDIEGTIHKAPKQYPAIVFSGDAITSMQLLFDTHKLYTRGKLPEYKDISEVALPIGPGQFVRIPNYMVPVKNYLGIRYLELSTTAGSFQNSVESVITNYQVQSIIEDVPAINALQYVMEQVFRNAFMILKFHHVTENSTEALQAIAQAVNSTKPLYACVAVAIEADNVNDCTLTVAGDSEIEGAGNPDTEAVNLVCTPGMYKIDFE